MDPTSIAGLVIATAEVISKLHAFGKAVRDGPVERAQLQNQLFGLKGVLEHLELMVQETEDDDRQTGVQDGFGSLSVHETKGPVESLLKTPETWQMVREADMTLKRLNQRLMEHPASSSSFKRSLARLSWPLKHEEMSIYISQLDRIKSYLTLVTTMDNHQLGMKIYQEVQDLKGLFQEQEENKKRSALRKAVSDWLSPCDVRSKHHEALKAKWRDTGRWFIEDHFRPWCQTTGLPNEKHRLLWLCGRSGSGKTVLLSSCIEEALHSEDLTRDHIILYFYCSLNDHASQIPVNVLGSYIRQLCDSSPQLARRIESLYSAACAKSFGVPNHLDLPQLEDILIRTCRELNRHVIFVLDSPNESSQDREMLSSLMKIITECPEHSRLIVASTEFVDAAKLGTYDLPLMQVDLDHKNIRHDLEVYIWSTIQRDKTLGRLSDPFQMEILETLLVNADGSFRWVQCQLDNIISNSRSIRDIRASLRNVPQTLERTYREILISIPPQDWPIVREILFWLAFAVRPLYLEELAEASAFSSLRKNRDESDPTGPNMSDEYRLLDPMSFVRQCHSLVRYISSEDWIALAHSSVHTYLLSEDILQSDVAYFHLSRGKCLEDVACLCLRYLQLPVFSGGICANEHDLEKRLDEWPFSDYAAKYWSEQTRTYLDFTQKEMGNTGVFDCRLLKELTMFCSTFHLPGAGNFAAWYQMAFPDGKLEVWTNTHPLYTAAREGFNPLVQAILSSPEGKDVLDRSGGNNDLTPLQVSLALDRPETVQLLLDAGANMWKPTTYWQDAVEMTLVFGDTKSKEILHRHCKNQPKGSFSSEQRARKVTLMDPEVYDREYKNCIASLPMGGLPDNKYNVKVL